MCGQPMDLQPPEGEVLVDIGMAANQAKQLIEIIGAPQSPCEAILVRLLQEALP